MELKDLKKLKDGNVTFEIVEEKEQWQESLARTSAALQKQKPLQGYCRGKAPLEAAYQAYGQALLEQASREFLTGAVELVCKEHALFPLSSPQITVTEANLSGIRASVCITVYPDISDFDYMEMEVEKPVRKVSEAEIDGAIDCYMREHRWVHEVERDARMGDIAEVSFTGTCEGEAFAYDHSDKARFRMGSGLLFAGLDEALLGHVAGDDLELSLTMPEDFHREAVRGKTLDLHVHLRSVCARELLECTDEFVKEKVKGVQTVAEFREMQRTKLQKQNDEKSERAFDRNLQKKLASFADCPIPEAMIEVSLEGLIRTLKQVAATAGKKVDQLLKEEGKTLEEYKQEVLYPMALEQVKASIALDYIMQKEKITVPKEAVDQLVNSYMQKAGVSYDAALEAMGGVESVTDKLSQDRTYAFVREHCKIVEIEVKKFPAGF